MGTTYAVKVISGRFTDTDHLEQLINDKLNEINMSMSTFIPESEISRFNRSLQPEKSFTPSEELLEVMRMSRKIHELSGGAWDGTLDPLVNLWGFGRDDRTDKVPSADEIAKRLELVDFGKVIITPDGKLRKNDVRVSVDLASIAKGYGVDQLAALLTAKGFENFLVEVGGEVYAAGHRVDGKSWKIGINAPRKMAGLNELYKVVGLGNAGFATSGDYRNFFEQDRKSYSHILDPRTGYPVTNGVVSASVMAKSCAFADGLATALMVLGPEEGIRLVEKLENVEALILVRMQDGKLKEYFSSSFSQYVL